MVSCLSVGGGGGGGCYWPLREFTSTYNTFLITNIKSKMHGTCKDREQLLWF